MMSTLAVEKTLKCNNGEEVTVHFEPSIHYQPKSAISDSTGAFSVYIDSRFIGSVNVHQMFFINRELEALDIENYNQANMVISGLYKIAIRTPF